MGEHGRPLARRRQGRARGDVGESGTAPTPRAASVHSGWGGAGPRRPCTRRAWQDTSAKVMPKRGAVMPRPCAMPTRPGPPVGHSVAHGLATLAYASGPGSAMSQHTGAVVVRGAASSAGVAEDLAGHGYERYRAHALPPGPRSVTGDDHRLLLVASAHRQHRPPGHHELFEQRWRNRARSNGENRRPSLAGTCAHSLPHPADARLHSVSKTLAHQGERQRTPEHSPLAQEPCDSQRLV